MVEIMNILILGGTAWLSSTIAHTATGRGHHVTCAARGTDTPPQGCAFIPLDRNQPDAYATLPNITWDAVVDANNSFPWKPPVSSGPASSVAPATPPAAAATIRGDLPTPPARRCSSPTTTCRWP